MFYKDLAVVLVCNKYEMELLMALWISLAQWDKAIHPESYPPQ